MDVALLRDVKNRDGIPTYLLAFSKRSVIKAKCAGKWRESSGEIEERGRSRSSRYQTQTSFFVLPSRRLLGRLLFRSILLNERLKHATYLPHLILMAL